MTIPEEKGFTCEACGAKVASPEELGKHNQETHPEMAGHDYGNVNVASLTTGWSGCYS